MRDDWGGDEGRLRDLWPPESLPREQLPSVVTARAVGWFLAPDAPMWSFLPAVWPSRDRRWIPDRSVRFAQMRCGVGPVTVMPWSAWDHAEYERDINELLLSVGVPPRPPGRLWLLRPPPGFPDLGSAMEELEAGIEADAVPFMCCSELVGWTRLTLARLFGEGR